MCFAFGEGVRRVDIRLCRISTYAGMAELADAQASGACGGNIVWVQVPFPAFFIVLLYTHTTLHYQVCSNLRKILKLRNHCLSDCPPSHSNTLSYSNHYGRVP